jgi:DNA-binding XRE family transcriptional regulator
MDAASLKTLREDRGESQEQFARHFGVGRTTVILWETKGTPEQGPGRFHIERVLAELQLSPAKSQ